ncbi:MAG: BrnA antitoxin family protein [Burkholderiales bacterium]|nr:BrnA antitoxin family protein [Burkholderiales bacterium]
MPPRPNPELIDNDDPEADEAWFAKARPAKEMLADMMGDAASKEMLKLKHGRPPSTAPKEHVNIRLDADIVQSFKLTGDGWQTRLNNALREWLSAHPM